MADKDNCEGSIDRGTESNIPRSPAVLQPNGRKRSLDTSDSIPQSPLGALSKKLREDPHEAVDDTSIAQEEPSKDVEDEKNPIRYWTKHFQWPEKSCLFHPNANNFRHLLAIPLSPAERRQVALEYGGGEASSASTSNDEPPRETNIISYKDVRYIALLSDKNISMRNSKLGPTPQSKQICSDLLETPQPVIPQDSLFRDDLFDRTCQNLQGKNKTRIIRDISLLLVPSAEILATYGALHLKILIESTGERWENCRPLTGAYPKPDFAVGFRREAFTSAQLRKLEPFIGDICEDESLFLGTYAMYFPFFISQVEAADIETAERKNADGMALAVRGVVELFSIVGRQAEIQREIVGWSVACDGGMVSIRGCYAEFEEGGKEIKYYSHKIHSFSFMTMEGRERWTAYRFVRNLYEVWMPMHFERLCSAVDQIPEGLGLGAAGVS